MSEHDSLKHQQDPRLTYQEVAELLNKQDVVIGLVGRQATPRQDLVQGLLQRQQSEELRRKLHKLHPADIAYILEKLSMHKRQLLWNLLEERVQGSVLLELSDVVRSSLIGVMDEDEIIGLASHLDASQIAELIPKLPRELALNILDAMDRKHRSSVQATLSFPRDSVGSLMEFDMATVRQDMTVDDVLNYLRKTTSLPDSMDQVFVVDNEGILQGVLPIREMLRNTPDAKVSGFMNTDPVTFHTNDLARDAAGAFERYDLISAPVLNLHDQLVGVLNVDRIMDFKDDLSERERLHQVGLSGDEDLFGPVWASARNRWVWLGLNLTTAFISTRVIQLFEHTISQLVALAVLMPIVASIGGNTGNQTVALMVRGLALRQITPENFARFFAKEIGISLTNGLIWGCVMALVVMVFYGQPALAAVMMGAMIANFLIAALVGVLIPGGLQYFGRDPVMGSSVLLTAVTDCMGFFTFLGLAALVLV